MAFTRKRMRGMRPMARPASPGKSAMAPGQMFKAMGLPNASSIAPGRTRLPVTKPSRVPPRARKA